MFQVMIVDDEPAVCLGMQRLIDWAAYGFEVTHTAANGQEALELHAQHHFDLIVTDLKMPVVDGVELIRRLVGQQDPCKIIIVSAYGEFSYAQTVMQYGVQYYLLKPVDETVMGGYLSKIAEDLSSHRESGDTNLDHKHFEHQYRMSSYGVITEVRRYINDHFGEPLTLNSLAKLYSFSPVYLGRLFKKETGVAFNEYLNRCRIDAAREYIDRGDHMIYEIAEKAGYKDINYFYKCFKSIVGVTPSEYRLRRDSGEVRPSK
jgi:two-component system, response regulator YesN